MFEKMNEFTNSIQALMDEVKKKIKEQGEQAAKSMFAEMFEKYPLVEQVEWCQGTPSFNDGDPCVFRMYDANFQLAEHGEFDGSWSLKYRFEKKGGVPKELESYGEMMDEVSGLLHSNMEVMQTLFGDGSKITVTKEKVSVEDYYMD